MGAYLLILYAYTLAPVSYVVAARESSVVIGALIGFAFRARTHQYKPAWRPIYCLRHSAIKVG